MNGNAANAVRPPERERRFYAGMAVLGLSVTIMPVSVFVVLPCGIAGV